MSGALAAAGGSQALWFVSRASGLVLLALFSAVVVLGVATRTGASPRGLPRFGVAELHRTLSLFALALLALHVLTAILDPYVTIGWAAAIIPFTSHYRTVAIGIGALALDLAAAIVITSVIRQHIGYRAWRTVHWLAYLLWPVAFIHSLGAGNDYRTWWAALVVWGSGAAVATSVGARLFSSLGRRPEHEAEPDAVLRSGRANSHERAEVGSSSQ
ncbi:MAG: ferric reductase-like transmembrane domain-containing protein [Acidimicrobiales bacterium]